MAAYASFWSLSGTNKFYVIITIYKNSDGTTVGYKSDAKPLNDKNDGSAEKSMLLK